MHFCSSISTPCAWGVSGGAQLSPYKLASQPRCVLLPTLTRPSKASCSTDRCGVSRAFFRAAAPIQPASKTATAEDVWREVQAASASSSSVIILFTAAWCGPCKLLLRELFKIEISRKQQVKILTVDAEEQKEFAAQLNVAALPTMLFVGRAAASKPAIAVTGFMPSKLIADILDNKLHLAGANLAQPLRLQ